MPGLDIAKPGNPFVIDQAQRHEHMDHTRRMHGWGSLWVQFWFTSNKVLHFTDMPYL